MHFSNEVCLVTGASRGIGAAIAKKLAEEGAFVIGTATSTEGATAISSVLGASGVGKVLNVSDEDQVFSLLKEIEGEYGKVSILVNNAGVTADNLLPRLKSEDWNQVIDVNLSSVYLLSKACLRGMLKNRSGRIINISSVVGHTGNSGQSAYSAAKAGIAGFTKSLAQEVGARGITVNAVAPGYIQTDMTSALSEEQRASIENNIPLARLGSVGDISEAVVFLASSKASYITGETLHVNGGMYMH